ncbi:MAG: hypothetical protein ACKOC4_09010 [Planctomycetia bacterium]
MTRRRVRKTLRRCVAPAAFEGLERRQALAIDSGLAWAARPMTAAASPAALAPATAAVGGTNSPATSASSLLATVVPYADVLFGDTQEIVTAVGAVARDFAPVGREFRTELPISVTNVPLGATVQMEVLTGLTTWNGRGGTPSFRPVPRGLDVNLQAAGVNLRVGERTNLAVPPQVGQIRRTMTFAASDGQPLERRIGVTIGTGGVDDRFTKPGATPGLYAFSGLLSIGGIETIRSSQPVTFVFRVGPVPDTAVQAAVAAFSAPATGPAAVLAMAGRSAGVDRPFSNAILITVDYSAPVTVSRQSPQLPIVIGGVRRLATLPVDAPRTNVRQLTFSFPLPGDVNEGTVMDIGTSLILPPGASIRTAGGTPAITSLPTAGSRGIPLEYQGAIASVSADITRNTTFRAGTTYVITAEVHVTEGTTLTIEDGVKVLIRNGYIPERKITAAALIFDSGSRLRAKTVSFAASDAGDRPAAQPLNGGVFFCGSFKSATKDNISSRSGVGVRSSSFIADRIDCSYLGRPDPVPGDGGSRDDIDAISLIGLGPTEWQVREVTSTNSGDDGFDVTNSSISMASLTVVNPAEDGLEIASSLVTITRGCTVAMSRSTAIDREIFDLETDDGPSRIVFQRLAALDLRGYWNDRYDEVRLNSRDMPQPSRWIKSWYEFVGTLNLGPAVVYSFNAD